MTDFQFLSILILIAQIGVAGWQAYLMQKSKNKADKEDIQDLTKLVESVKIDFNKELAKTHTDLDILKDKKGKSYSQAQQAIVQYYSDLNVWMQTLLGIFPSKFNESQLEELMELDTNIETLFRKANVSNALLGLLVEDGPTIDMAHTLLQSTLDLQSLVHTTISTLQIIFRSERGYAPQLLKLGEMSAIMDDHVRNTLLRLEEDKKSTLKDYSKKRLALYKTIIPLQREFKDLAKEYLKA